MFGGVEEDVSLPALPRVCVCSVGGVGLCREHLPQGRAGRGLIAAPGGAKWLFWVGGGLTWDLVPAVELSVCVSLVEQESYRGLR